MLFIIIYFLHVYEKIKNRRVVENGDVSPSTFHPLLSLSYPTLYRAPAQRYPGVRAAGPARPHAGIPLYMKVTARIRLLAVYNTVLAIG